MSYCRFSTFGFTSEVYVYDDYVFGGVVIHVASEKCFFHPDHPYPILEYLDGHINKEAAIEFKKQYDESMDHATFVPLYHPLAGRTLFCNTRREAMLELTRLREDGICVPDIAIEGLSYTLDMEGDFDE